MQAQAELSRTEGNHALFFPPLPPGWSLVREMECICDYDFYSTGDPERANGCGGTYYRRISISATGIVHNERSKCLCAEKHLNNSWNNTADELRREQCEAVKRDISRLFTGRNLLEDEVHQHMTLGNFIVENPTQKKALLFLTKFRPGKDGVCLYGGPGRGKTHLAVGLARKLETDGYTCLAIKSIDLLNRIKKTYQREDRDEVEIINALKKVEILVIDDIGTERPTGWVLEKLYEIIDYRTSRKSTIFTTNLSGAQMEKKLGTALVSRIYGVGSQLEVDGPDRRVKADLWSDLGTEVDIDGHP